MKHIRAKVTAALIRPSSALLTSAKKRCLFMLALVWVVMFGTIVIPGNGQSTYGTILGTLTDATGAVVGNTNIQLINQATNVKTETQSNGSGYYQFVDVPAGTYRLVVQKNGFKQLSRSDILLQTEARIEVDLALQVGAATETVEVTAASPLIEADNVSLGTVVDERETNELPLNGRNPMNLTALVPSVIPLGQSSGTPTGVNMFGWGNYQIGGGMAGQSVTYIDGAPDNGNIENNLQLIPSQDSIREFKVETNNLSAQYGALAGGAINFTTKSGTKDIHANAWEYIRNKVLNANSYYSNLAGLPRGSFTQNQYGFNIGGPVFIPHVYDGRKKTFFFVNWEGFGLRQGETYTTSVPTAAELNGDVSLLAAPGTLYDPKSTCTVTAGCPNAQGTGIDLNYGDRLPLGWDLPGFTGTGTNQLQTTAGYSNSINPTALAYWKVIMPPPNTTGTAQGLDNYTANAPGGGNNYQTVVHIDHNFSDKQHLSARYTYWQNLSLAVDPLKTGICANGSCAENYKVNNFVIDDSYTLSLKSILDVRLSYMRFAYTRTPKNTTFDVTAIGWPSEYQSLVEFPGPPAFVVPTFDQAGLFSAEGADSNIGIYQDNYRLAGMFTRFVGNHTLTFGAEYEMQDMGFHQSNFSAGLYGFSPGWTGSNALSPLTGTGLDAASYLLGYPASGSTWYDNRVESNLKYPGIFATDDWRATHKLTFHMGIRWEYTTPFTERHDLLNAFDASKPNDALTAAALPGVSVPLGNIELVNSTERPSRYGINPYGKEISPRFGLSYSVTSNTVVTAGYGIFWLPSALTTNQNPSYDGTSSQYTPYVGSANGGLTPSNSISTPYPLTNPSDPTSAYIILPVGRALATAAPFTGLFQYQVNTLGNGITSFFPNDPAPGYAQQWNFGIQRQFGKSTALNVAYSGSKATHLSFTGINTDQLPDSDLAQGSALFAPVANPYYDAIPAGNSLKLQNLTAGQIELPYPEFAGVTDGGAHLGSST